MRAKASSFILVTLLLATAPAWAVAPTTTPTPAPELPAPDEFKAVDNPGDSGGKILLTWKDPAELPEGAMLEVRRAAPPADEFAMIKMVLPGKQRFIDGKAKDGETYRYELRVRGSESPDSFGIAGAVGPALLSEPVSAHDSWFRPQRTNSFIASILFIAFTLTSIAAAKSGKPIFIRRIAGLSAVDEAIGRATELGKKVLYVPGSQSIDEIQTIASMAILGHVARATARNGADLDVPNRDPLTFVTARETVKSAYLAAGRPDIHRDDMVNYITYDQFAYTAAVSARMIRERPAAIFLVGYFFAESLILAETGQSTGAIQIAGQADPTQLPFFVATCDYTLIGEELYAASAYLSREPVLLGSMRAQDMAKALLMILGVVGIVAMSLGATWFAGLMKTQ